MWWMKFLDKIGLDDPWVQIAITGILKTLAIIFLPGVVIGLILGMIFYK